MATAIHSHPTVLTPLKEFGHATIYAVEDHPDSIVIKAHSGYIPKRAFEQIFGEVTEFVKTLSITRIVFDKSNLSVFHQPSMEWYFLVWKEALYRLGVRIHRKILPPDPIFCESARIARQKLEREYPQAKFHLMDIRYSASIEDALVE